MGIFIGILTAIAASSLDLFLKKLKGLHPNFLTLVRGFAATPSLALAVTVFSTWQIPPLEFWALVILAKVPLELLLAYVSTKALHLSELSIIGPLAGFTSIFLIPVGYFILGELPTSVGLVGIIFILVGSFFVGSKKGEHIIRGWDTLLRDKGVLLAILGAFLASLTVSITKLTFNYAPPLVTAFYAIGILTLVLIPTVSFQAFPKFEGKGRALAGLWATSFLSQALHYVGLSIMPAAYFISIKRLSMIFNVLLGKHFFGETNIRQRLIGAVIMAVGVVFIYLG